MCYTLKKLRVSKVYFNNAVILTDYPLVSYVYGDQNLYLEKSHQRYYFLQQQPTKKIIRYKNLINILFNHTIITINKFINS